VFADLVEDFGLELLLQQQNRKTSEVVEKQNPSTHPTFFPPKSEERKTKWVRCVVCTK
jgi:hypothetical protein